MHFPVTVFLQMLWSGLYLNMLLHLLKICSYLAGIFMYKRFKHMFVTLGD